MTTSRRACRFFELPATRPASRIRRSAAGSTARSSYLRTSRLLATARKASMCAGYPAHRARHRRASHRQRRTQSPTARARVWLIHREDAMTISATPADDFDALLHAAAHRPKEAEHALEQIAVLDRV